MMGLLWARRKPHARSVPNQLSLPFDSAELQVAEVGSLVVLRYRREIVIAVRGPGGEVDSIEGDDYTLSTVAGGLRGAA